MALSFDFLIRDKGSKPLRNIGDEADRTSSKLRGIASAGAGIGRFGVSAGKALGVASLGLAGLGAAAAGMGLKTAAAMEQADISFTTMLGSGQKADAFLKDLQKFAAKTPFEFPELQTAASSLISAGINANKVIPIMTTLGDVTSGMGTGSEGVQRATIALQQMSAAGRITGEDLNQLRDAGIPVFDLLASATGKSKKEVVALAQAGKLGEKELGLMMTALETGKGLERFSGLMAKQSASMSGMWSTLKDTVNMGLANVMGAFQPIISKAMPGIIGMSEKMGKSLAGAAQNVIPKIEKLGDAFGVLFETGPDASQGFAEIMDNAFGNTGKYVSLFRTIGDGVRAAVHGVSGFFAALKDGDVTSDGFVGTMESLGATVKEIFQAAGPQIKVTVGQLMELGRVAAPLVQKAFGIIGEVISRVIAVVGPIISQIRSVLIGAFKEAAPQISQAMTSIREIVLGLLTIIQAAWQRFGPTILAVVKIAFGTIIQVIGGVLKAISGVVKLVMAVIKGDWSGAWDAIKQIFSGVWQAIKGLLSGVLEGFKLTFVAAMTFLKDAWGRLWGGIKGVFTAAWEGVKTAAKDAFRWVVDKFLGFGEDILEGAAKVFGWVPGLGPKLKEAAEKFREFRDDVNEALGGIDDKTISLHAKLGLQPASSRVILDKNSGMAHGGRIPGLPSARDNRMMPVATGEFVVNARETARNLPLLEAINAGRAHGLAGGGLNVSPQLSGTAGFAKRARDSFQEFAQKNIEQIMEGISAYTPGGGPFPSGGSGVGTWRGKRYTHAMIARLQLAERIAGSVLHVSQGGFRPTTSYSGTTHNKDAVDVGSPTTVRVQNALRAAGIAAWIRTPDQGPWSRHIHGIPLPGGGVQLSRSAYQQTQAYLRGGDGLKGFDKGGILKPGLNLAWNGTGRDEVVPAPGAGRVGAGVTINVTVQGGVYGDKRQAGREIADAIAAFTAGGGRVTVKAG